MKESILQYELIMWFEQTYPEFRGLLFKANNDLIIFVVPDKGIISVIELKAPFSSHNTSQVRKQLEFGRKIIKQGGYYIMTSDIKVAMTFLESLAFKGAKHDLIQAKSLNDVQEKLRINTKTIKF